MEAPIMSSRVAVACPLFTLRLPVSLVSMEEDEEDSRAISTGPERSPTSSLYSCDAWLLLLPLVLVFLVSRVSRVPRLPVSVVLMDEEEEDRCWYCGYSGSSRACV